MCGCTAPEDRGSIIAARTSLLATRRPAAQLLALTRDQVDCSAEQRLQDNDRFAKERPATQLRGHPVPLDEAANVVAGPSRPQRGDVRPIWELPWLAFPFWRRSFSRRRFGPSVFPPFPACQPGHRDRAHRWTQKARIAQRAAVCLCPCPEPKSAQRMQSAPPQKSRSIVGLSSSLLGHAVDKHNACAEVPFPSGSASCVSRRILNRTLQTEREGR
jgi:hypothetical protein